MQKILRKADEADFAFLIGQLKCWFNFSGGKKLDAALEAYREGGTAQSRQMLTTLLEKEIRYAGSADLAYLVRWTFASEAGVNVDKMIMEAASKLKVKVKPIGSVEAKLERLVRGVVEKEFTSMSPEDQRELLKRHGVKDAMLEELLRLLKRQGPVAALPLLLSVAGKQVVQKLLTNLTMSIVAKYMGREAAKKLLGEMAKRFPWWAEWIGPIAWGVSGAWLALDLQGPAFRKTLPVLLYLGLVGLRDGPEDGDEFWHGTSG